MVCVALFLVWGYGEYVGDVVDFACTLYLCHECILLCRRSSGVELA